MSAVCALMPAHAAFENHLIALRDMIEDGDWPRVKALAEDLAAQADAQSIQPLTINKERNQDDDHRIH